MRKYTVQDYWISMCGILSNASGKFCEKTDLWLWWSCCKMLLSWNKNLHWFDLLLAKRTISGMYQTTHCQSYGIDRWNHLTEDLRNRFWNHYARTYLTATWTEIWIYFDFFSNRLLMYFLRIYSSNISSGLRFITLTQCNSCGFIDTMNMRGNIQRMHTALITS